MSNKWFGVGWGANVCTPEDHTATPVGEFCHWCDERIEPGDQGMITNGGTTPYHLPCFMRGIAGSLGHLAGLCSCTIEVRNKHHIFEGLAFDDLAYLTKREAAQSAFDYDHERHPGMKMGVLVHWLTVSHDRHVAGCDLPEINLDIKP